MAKKKENKPCMFIRLQYSLQMYHSPERLNKLPDNRQPRMAAGYLQQGCYGGQTAIRYFRILIITNGMNDRQNLAPADC